MIVSIILDEEKYAKEVLSGQHMYLNVTSASKYIVRLKYRDYINDNGKLQYTKLYEYVVDELSRIYDSQDVYKNIDKVKKIVKKYSKSKYDLRKSDGIKVTKKELEKISGLNNKLLELLAFSILVIKKAENFKYNSSSRWFNMEFRDYYKTVTNDKRCMRGQNSTLRRLEQNGLIEFPILENCGKTKGFELRYMELDDSDCELLIDDIREIPLIYKKYKGENIIECKECGRLVERIKNRNTIYCEKCKQNVKNAQNKEYKLEKRKT